MQWFTNGILASAILLQIAISFHIIYTTVRFFHLAHAGTYTTGAYVAYGVFWLLSQFFVPTGGQAAPFLAYGASTLAAMLFCGLLGVGMDQIVYAPLRRRGASPLILLLASFGIAVVIENVIVLICGNEIRSVQAGPVREAHLLAGVRLTTTQIGIVISSGVLFAGLSAIYRLTDIGKVVRGVAEDPLGASLVGIDPEKVTRLAFFLGSALAGLAGAITSLETNLEPTMGFLSLLRGVAAIIVGGIGSLWGLLLGCLILGVSENLAAWYLPAGWKDAVAFAILICFLILKREGLLGVREQRAG
jgi:branched-chain amino acid transport system permease protein